MVKPIFPILWKLIVYRRILVLLVTSEDELFE